MKQDYQPAGQVPADARSQRAAAYGNRGAIPNGAARSQAFTGQLRAAPVMKSGQQYYEVEGTASVVDKPYTMYDMFGPYQETIKRGAFDATLANKPDVAFLTNHRGVTMARTTNGSLELSATPDLTARAFLNADRQDVRDLVSAIADELITEMSFAFYLTAGGWNADYDEFTIYEVDINRGDVSAVNYGANPYTSIAARSAEILAELGQLPAGAAREALNLLARRFAIPLDSRGQVPEILPPIYEAAGTRAAAHGAHDGEHSHAHPAYGSQGGDAMHTHAHAHAGDDNHDHQHANAAGTGDPVPVTARPYETLSAVYPTSTVSVTGGTVTSVGDPTVAPGKRVMSVSLLSAMQEADNELDAADD